MMVMPTNNTGVVCGWIAGKYEGRIGWLMSPGGYRRPEFFMQYALDNGAYGAWTSGKDWDEVAFYHHLDKYRGFRKPMWVAVPDVVTDREATIASWHKHAPRIRSEYGYKVAFVVQDGMNTRDVPDCDVVFVGGSTGWKWRHLAEFTQSFSRVHVGRVNSERLLWMAHEAGAESCDGTGWFRGNQEQLAGLLRYLDESTNGRKQLQMEGI